MQGVSEADASNWNQLVSESEVLTVVYFWHEQCPWCVRLNPIFNDVTQRYEGRIRFVKLNILQDPSNRQIAANYGVMSTPTLMFFCRGRPIGQGIGFMLEDDLTRVLDDMLGRYKNCLAQSSDLRAYIV